jgi:hypothetical protein
MVCKVNPKNVVSIPADYNNSKMRVCEYEVIDELNMADIKEFDEALKAVYVPCDDGEPLFDDEPEYAEDEDDGYCD